MTFWSNFWGQSDKPINKENKVTDIIHTGDNRLAHPKQYFYFDGYLEQHVRHYYSDIRLDADWLNGTVQGVHEYNQPQGLALQIAELSSSYLFGRDVKFKILDDKNDLKEDETRTLNDWLETQNIEDMKSEIGVTLSGLGGCSIKLNLDKTGSPILKVIQPDEFLPVFLGGNLIELHYFTLLQTFENTAYFLVEKRETSITGNLIITYLLKKANTSSMSISYQTTDGFKSAEPATLENLDNEVADRLRSSGLVLDTPIISTLKGLGSVYIKNKSFNAKYRVNTFGMSDLSSVRSLLTELDYISTQYLEEFRLGKNKIIASTQMMGSDIIGNKKFLLDETMFFEKQGSGDLKDDKMEIIQFNIRVTEYETKMQSMKDKILMKAGFDAGLLTVDGSGGFKTATEVIAETDITFKTMDKKRSIAIKPLTDVLQFGAESLGIQGKVKIELPPVQQNNMSTLTENVAKAETAVSMSVKTKVEILHPEWEPEQVIEETIKIKTEKSIPLTVEEEETGIKNKLINNQLLLDREELDDPKTKTEPPGGEEDS